MAPQPNATCTVPEASGKGEDVVLGDVAKKRKQEQSAESRSRPRKKARNVSDEEAKAIIGRMHALGKEMINASLPDMVAGLPLQKKAWGEYKDKHRDKDLKMGGFLMTLARSKGFFTV